MKQKSAEKLFAGHPHQPLLALMGIVLPAKRNLAVGNFHDPVIGDGNPQTTGTRSVRRAGGFVLTA